MFLSLQAEPSRAELKNLVKKRNLARFLRKLRKRKFHSLWTRRGRRRRKELAVVGLTRLHGSNSPRLLSSPFFLFLCHPSCLFRLIINIYWFIQSFTRFMKKSKATHAPSPSPMPRLDSPCLAWRIIEKQNLQLNKTKSCNDAMPASHHIIIIIIISIISLILLLLLLLLWS